MYEGTILICAHCGMSFEQTTTHPRTYCSDACAARAATRRSKNCGMDVKAAALMWPAKSLSFPRRTATAARPVLIWAFRRGAENE